MTSSYIGPPRNLSTAGRNALAAGSRPPGMQIFNTDNNRIEFNAGSDAVPNWLPFIPNQYGTVFPTTGLFNGYRFTLFSSYTTDVNVSGDFIYRADIDATYPWHFVGGQDAYNTAGFSGMTSSVWTDGATLTVPRDGYYTAFWAGDLGFNNADIRLFVNGSDTNQHIGYGNVVDIANVWQGAVSAGGVIKVQGIVTSGGGGGASSLSVRPRKLS